MPKYGPASFFQRTVGRRTPAERARAQVAEAAQGFQPGLPKEFVLIATEMVAAIKQAYDVVAKERGI